MFSIQKHFNPLALQGFPVEKNEPSATFSIAPSRSFGVRWLNSPKTNNLPKISLPYVTLLFD
jgi:hypothetical protein